MIDELARRQIVNLVYILDLALKAIHRIDVEAVKEQLLPLYAIRKELLEYCSGPVAAGGEQRNEGCVGQIRACQRRERNAPMEPGGVNWPGALFYSRRVT